MDFMTIFKIVLCIILFFFGAAVYSFLNVVIFRVPRGEEFVKTRSHCPGCGRVLTPWELIPVVSYVCLGGKCKNCGSKIGLRDVSIEVFGGLSAIASVAFTVYVKMYALSMTDTWLGIDFFTLLGLVEVPYVNIIYSIMLKSLAYFVLICVLTVICFINIDTGKVNVGTLIAFVVAGGYGVIAMPYADWASRLIGLAVGAAVFLVIGALAKKKELLSCAVLAGVAGAVLGWQELLAVGVIAVVLGALLAILLLLTGNKKLQDRFKPVPLLCTAILIGLFFGTRIAGLLVL